MADLCAHQHKIWITRVDGNVADARPTVIEEAEIYRAIERANERTRGAGSGTGLLPGLSVVRRYEHACAVIGIKAGGGLLTRAGVNDRRIGRRESDRAHGQRGVLVTHRGPRRAGVGGAPDSAHRAADQDRAARGIARVHRNGLDAAANRAEKSASGGLRTDGRPSSTDRGAGLRCGRIGAVRAKNELAFGGHHALQVLKRFQSRAGRDVAIRGAALVVKPFSALANQVGLVLGLAGFARREPFGSFARVGCARLAFAAHRFLGVRSS